MNNNKVLVTGADGFIGSHLVELLVAKGYKVKALAQYNSFNHWGWLEDISCKDQVEIICGDIRDPHFCRHITKNVDMIFHLAALIAIPYSYIAPESYVSTNVTGTLNICHKILDSRKRVRKPRGSVCKQIAVYEYPGYETGQWWTLEPGNLEGGFWGDQ